MARTSGVRIPVSVDHRTPAAVRRSVLPNGIRVITDTTAAGGSATAISILIECGTSHERCEDLGLANLAAQVVLQGTTSRSALQAGRDGERFRVGATVDASHSCFRARLEPGKSGHSPGVALDLLADLIGNATCYEDAIDLERRAILNEIAMADAAPARHTRALLRSAVWRNHGLGRPVLGTAESLRRLDRRSILAFVERHYRSSSIVVAAAGPVDHDSFAGCVSDSFGGIEPSGPIASKRRPIWHPDALHKRADLRESYFAIGLPAVEFGHPLSASFQLLDRVTGGGIHSRLYRRLKIEKNLVTRIRSTYQPFTDTGIWMIEGTTARHEEALAVRAVLDQLHSFGNDCPITPEELWLAGRELHEAAQTAARDLDERARRAAYAEACNAFTGAGHPPHLPLGERQAAEVDALARRTLPVWLPELGLARLGPFEAAHRPLATRHPLPVVPESLH